MKKRLIAGALVLLVGVNIQAGNTAHYFEKGKTKTGGVIDNEVIFIYEKEMKYKSESDLKIITNIAKQKICSDKSARVVIDEAGMSVKYIYMSKESAVIVKIDSCDGIEAKVE